MFLSRRIVCFWVHKEKPVLNHKRSGIFALTRKWPCQLAGQNDTDGHLWCNSFGPTLPAMFHSTSHVPLLPLPLLIDKVTMCACLMSEARPAYNPGGIYLCTCLASNSGWDASFVPYFLFLEKRLNYNAFKNCFFILMRYSIQHESKV